jgi:hypothetical protein
MGKISGIVTTFTDILLSYWWSILVILVCVVGCFEGPTGPQGEHGERGTSGLGNGQLVLLGISIADSNVVHNEDDSYTVTIQNECFKVGYWYDVWIVGADAQIHVDTFVADSKVYGMILIKPGLMKFDYTFDLTGYALLVVTDYHGEQ